MENLNNVTDPIEKEKAWEDLGRPEDSLKRVRFSFVISVDSDGYIKTELINPNEHVERKASTFDVYQACKEVASNIEAQVMIDRVVDGVMKALKPQNPSEEVRDSIKSALSDRGIDTSKA